MYKKINKINQIHGQQRNYKNAIKIEFYHVMLSCWLSKREEK